MPRPATGDHSPEVLHRREPNAGPEWRVVRLLPGGELVGGLGLRAAQQDTRAAVVDDAGSTFGIPHSTQDEGRPSVVVTALLEGDEEATADRLSRFLVGSEDGSHVAG